MSSVFELRQADALRMPLKDAVVDLWCCSPPYGLDITYNNEGGGDIDPLDWQSWMEQLAAVMYRCSKPGARVAINVPLDTSARKLEDGGTIVPPRPTYAETVAAFQWKWSYRCSIIWQEDNISKSVARGSLDSANAPCIISRAEMIAVFHKGEWNRGQQGVKTLTREEWLEYTNGTWRFPGETRAWEKFPCAFPLELPRRLIRLLSLPGDLVVDPTCGSGTTVLAALQEGNRHVIGFDLFQDTIESAKRRMKAHGF